MCFFSILTLKLTTPNSGTNTNGTSIQCYSIIQSSHRRFNCDWSWKNSVVASTDYRFASLICRSARSDHVSPILLASCRKSRVQRKINILIFKSLNNPSCLSDLIQLYVTSRQPRSSANTRLLRLLSAQLKSSGRRAFFYQSPLLWNKLRYSLRHSSSMASFKAAPKTHLFSSGLYRGCAVVCIQDARKCVESLHE